MSVSFAFVLNKPVATKPPAVVGQEQPYAAGTSGIDAILGKGILSTFRQDGRGDFATATGAELVRSNIEQILGTIASSGNSVGELPWKPEFGSLVHMLKHGNNDETLEALAQEFVVGALERWEPRVRVRTSRITRDVLNGILRVSLSYDIVSRRRKSIVSRGHNETFNFGF